MDVRVGLWRKLSAKELMLLNCGVGEDSWESLRLQGDPIHLKEISPGCSLGGLMLKLKLQYFGHLMWRIDSLEKTLMLGGIEGQRRRGWQRIRWLDGITISIGHEFEWTLAVGDGPGGLACCDSWGRKESHVWVTELNWTETKQSKWYAYCCSCDFFWVGRGEGEITIYFLCFLCVSVLYCQVNTSGSGGN